jgi:hypothetical protein
MCRSMLSYKKFYLAVKLNEDAATCAVTFFEFFWCAAFFLFEDAVKIGNIIKTTVIGNLRNAVGSIN